MSAALPAGTVTFMFTDIEGSTRIVQDLGDRWPAVLEDHDSIARLSVTAHDGHFVRTEGDSVFAVFASATDAVSAAVEMQRRLQAHSWPDDGVVRARIGLHTGRGALGGADYVGIDVHRAARIAASAHGGQIVVSETTCSLAERAVPGVEFRDLGKHRLKDLAEPETILQVIVDGLPSEFPPLSTLERVAHNLPIQVTSFVGREAELAELVDMLDHARIVTLLGPGGTGKTRLSLQVAAECAEHFDDGAFFVPLASLTDPELLPSAILSELGVPVSSRDRPPRERLVEVFSARSILLVLDNFEHLVSAADVVSELVRISPESRVLVTSRVPLRVAGEQQVPLAPLDIEVDANLGVDRAADMPAVELFVDRATAVDPSFRLTDDNVTAVVELVRRLDGLPLAIELVAPQLRLLPVDAVLERLDTSALAGGPRDAPERHRTLRNALSWSVESLTESERRLLAILSVFAGGARLEEIEAVCRAVAPDVDVLHAMGGLIEHSLVTRASTGGVRFAWLNVIGRYASELPEVVEVRDQVAAAHAAAFAVMAEAAAAEILTAERATWLGMLDRDHDNLRAALGWATDRGEADLAFRLAWAMWRFWQTRGHIYEAKQILQSVLAIEGGDPARRAKAIEAAGGIAWWEGDLVRAAEHYTRALEMQRSLGDRSETANALYNNALTLAYGQTEAEASKAQLDEARAIYASLEDPGGMANVDWALGTLGSTGLVPPEAAMDALRRSIDGYARAGNVFGEGWANFELAVILVRCGDHEAAEPYLQRGLQLLEGSRDYSAAVLFVGMFASIAFARGDRERAVRLASAAYGIRDLSGLDIISIPVNQLDGLSEADLAELDGDLAIARDEGRRLGYEGAISLARQDA